MYPSGFDFAGSSKRLVESHIGQPFTPDVERELQSRMFERRDGLWFFTDQICGQAQCDAVAAKCIAWLQKYPVVVLERLGETLLGHCKHLDDAFDCGKFAEHCIRQNARTNNIDFGGKRGNRICFMSDKGEASAKRRMGRELAAYLRGKMDAVSVSEIEDIFPSITGDWLQANLDDLLPEAVADDLGESADAVKLIEHYYLPDDFEKVLNDILASLQDYGEILSTARIAEALDRYYKVNFMQDFAMSERAFKQIVSRFDAAHRSWAGSVLNDMPESDALTFREMVENRFPGVFSHDEFYEFGRTTWGWGEEHRAWHHKQLWKSFMRYDDDHWSSVNFFKKKTNWSDIAALVEKVMTDALGSSPFFPLARITQNTLDALPSLEHDGCQVEWTRELFASVAVHCLPSITTLNHAKLPYSVTTLLVPSGTKDKTDGIGYMLGIYKERNPHTATVEDAFAFLKENNVRVNFVESLKKTIMERISS